MQVYVDRVDGTSERVAGSQTGDDWEVAPSEILSSSPYDGEVVDLRYEEAGWDRPGDRLGDMANAPRWTDVDDPVLATIYGRPGSRERRWTRAQVVDGPFGGTQTSPLYRPPLLPRRAWPPV